MRRSRFGLALSLPLALALGVLSTACSNDSRLPTHPSISANRQANGDDDREDHPVTYAVIGDVPYAPFADATTRFPTLISAINGDPAVSRVIHLGDIKSGSTVCSDAYFQTIATAFATFTDPLVYAIGDNEWTDCHRANKADTTRSTGSPRSGSCSFPIPASPWAGSGCRSRIRRATLRISSGWRRASSSRSSTSSGRTTVWLPGSVIG